MDPILNEVMALALKLEENVAYPYQFPPRTFTRSSHQGQPMKWPAIYL